MTDLSMMRSLHARKASKKTSSEFRFSVKKWVPFQAFQVNQCAWTKQFIFYVRCIWFSYFFHLLKDQTQDQSSYYFASKYCSVDSILWWQVCFFVGFCPLCFIELLSLKIFFGAESNRCLHSFLDFQYSAQVGVFYSIKDTPCYNKTSLGSKQPIFGIIFFRCYLPRLSRKNHSWVKFISKFGPRASNLCQDFSSSDFLGKDYSSRATTNMKLDWIWGGQFPDKNAFFRTLLELPLCGWA